MVELSVGDMAPDIKLPQDREGMFNLSELRGKFVVLFFYPKDNTSGCTKEAVSFSQLQDEFQRIGTVVAGISPDGEKSHKKFRDAHDLSVALVCDEEKQALQAYGVWVKKSMYGREYMGVERSTFLIDAEGKIAMVWRKVKVPGHAEAVLASARELVAV